MAMSPRLLRPRAPSGFNPRTLSGLSAWYDASVTSSVTLTGGFVSQWNDLSGNGINLSQSTEANRPGTATVNGRQAVDFDGSNDNLATTTEVTPGTVFNVHIIDTSAAQSVYGVQSGSGATLRSSSLIFSSLGEYRSQSVASGFNAGFSGGSRTANPRISVHTFSGTAIAGRLDGAGFAGTTTTTGTNVNGVWLGIRNIGGSLALPMDGKICEHLIYDRVLSATEIATVERYLANKWGVTLAPTVTNADAQAWINNVYANGGTVSTATANAVNTFCNDIESAGLRSLLWRVNPMAGDNLSAALVPLYRGPSSGGTEYGNATDTNDNFVSGDYVASTGLIGNASTKRLRTGLPLNFNATRHMGCFVHTLPTAGFRTYLGGTGATEFVGLFRLIGSSTASTYTLTSYSEATTAGGSGATAVAAGDFIIGTQGDGANTAINYTNGVAGGTTGTGRTSGTIATGISIYTQALSGGTFNYHSNARLGGYTIGDNLSDSQALAYYNIWDTLVRALGRK